MPMRFDLHSKSHRSVTIAGALTGQGRSIRATESTLGISTSLGEPAQSVDGIDVLELWGGVVPHTGNQHFQSLNFGHYSVSWIQHSTIVTPGGSGNPGVSMMQ